MMSESGRYWQDRRVLVTGAAGFLGSWLAKDLVDRGAHVICLIRDVVPDSYLRLTRTDERVVRVAGSLEDYAGVQRILNEYDVDTCFHLAAQPLVTVALRNPLSTFESNIRGTYTLLEAIRTVRPECHVAVASSDKVYGDAHELPYREDFALQGLGPYDLSKVCTDLVAQSYAKFYGLRVAIARCGNFYGPGDLNWSRIVPGTSRSLFEGRRPDVRSDGTYLRDYLFIEDASRAYLALAQRLGEEDIRGEVFNFGTEQPTPVLAVIEQLTSIAGRADLQPRILNEAQVEIRHQYLSSQKAKNVLGWESRVSLADGLAASYRWYAEFLGGRLTTPAPHVSD